MARHGAGFKSQKALAEASGVSRPTIARAELKGDEFPEMGTDLIVRIVRACEARGVRFVLPEGASPAGGWAIMRPLTNSQPKENGDV